MRCLTNIRVFTERVPVMLLSFTRACRTLSAARGGDRVPG